MAITTAPGVHAPGTGPLFATTPRALGMVVLAGAAMSLQAFINGRLGARIGSFEVAAAINNAVGLLGLAAAVVLGGALGRARAALHERGRPPLWYLAGGLLGAIYVIVSAAAAPIVGVALMTVAFVCGTTISSLAVDALGMGPAGRRPITPNRLAGVALAAGATVIGALGSAGDFQPLVLALAFGAGVANGVQGAANGQLARVTGESSFAAFVNFGVGFLALATIAAVVLAVDPPTGSAPPLPLLAGGLCGIFIVFVLASGVQTLGTLRSGLGMVAGQTLGGLVLDLIAPVPGEHVTLYTLAGVVLVLAAVVISGRGRQVAPD